ncbi:MAG: cysteine--tRNA ligase [Proteobacteria bacterium]|nr:cysteine--tRNA ligase [Pseudomonadota bacterium]
MDLYVYNTLTNSKEKFSPVEEGKIKMYVCGITAYDYSHIGHARVQIVFDAIYRFLKKRLNYKVDYVRNYTDIDDKIINKAKDEGVNFKEVSEKYIKAFDEDMDLLGIEKPTYTPKATEYIDKMIEMIKRLIEKGCAYEVDGDVYFSVESFPEYGKLSKKPLDELRSGARVDVDERKKSPLDFALWKRKRFDYEPSWNSPFGEGRPGWHLECSTMSLNLLGETFDIHGGGMDLIFPHHENEIAQSEAYTGKPFVKYWLHNGFVNINKEKMSKSLGNILTIREIVKKFHPEALKLFVLSSHYRSPIDYDDDKLGEFDKSIKRLYLTLKNWQDITENKDITETLSDEEKLIISDFEKSFDSAMCDDFNTAVAVSKIFDFTKEVNKIIQTKGKNLSDKDIVFIKEAYLSLKDLSNVLGILQEDPVVFFDKALEKHLADLDLSKGDIENLIKERTEARTNKDYAKADEIRSKLYSMGIELEDTKEGTRYRIRI